MRLFLLLLLILVGCNSQQATMTSIQKIADPTPTVPYIMAVSPNSVSGIFKNGQLGFTVVMSKPVKVTGAPTLNVRTEFGDYQATYASGSGTTSLVFNLPIISGMLDENGVEITEIKLNGGSVYDPEKNEDALLTPVAGSITFPNHRIDAITASMVEIQSYPDQAIYTSGNNMIFILRYDYPVYVTGGAPSFLVEIAGNSIPFVYDPLLSTPKNHAYRYTVQSGLYDNDDYQVNAQTLALNGATITDFSGDPANTVTFSAINYTGTIINSIGPARASDLVKPTDRKYYAGEVLQFSITYNNPVSIQGTAPKLELILSNRTAYATATSVVDTNKVIFSYTVQPGDTSGSTLFVSNTVKDVGSLKDTNGNSVTDNSAWDSTTNMSFSGIVIDGVAPVITGISSPQMGSFKSNDNVQFVVTFSEPITLTGSANLKVKMESTFRFANCGTNTTTSLICSFAVPSGVDDIDGIEVLSPMTLQSSDAIRDGSVATANNADLTFVDKIFPNIKIDNTPPTITNVQLVAEGSYTVGSALSFKVTFSEPMNPTSGTNTAYLPVTVGANIQAALVQPTAPTTEYTFKIPALGEIDLDGVSVGSALNTADWIFKDLAGNQLTSFSLGTNSGIKKAYVVPAALKYWFDANDSLSVGTGFPASALGKFDSKASTLAGTIYGSISAVQDGKGKYYAKFGTGKTIDLPTISTSVYQVLIVHKETSGVQGVMLYDTQSSSLVTGGSTDTAPLLTLGSSPRRIEFLPSGFNTYIGLGTSCVSPPACTWFTGSGWDSINSLGELLYSSSLYNFPGTTTSYQKLMVNYQGVTNSKFRIGDSGYNGAIAEIMIFTTSIATDTTTINAINSYLNTKYDTSLNWKP